MTRRGLRCASIACVLTVCLGSALAAWTPAQPPREPSSQRSKWPPYLVVRIRDPKGLIRFEAIAASSLKARRKTLDESYLRAARAWKRKPRGPRPTKPALRVWEVKNGPDARALALAAAAQYQKRLKWEKRKADEAAPREDLPSEKEPPPHP